MIADGFSEQTAMIVVRSLGPMKRTGQLLGLKKRKTVNTN